MVFDQTVTLRRPIGADETLDARCAGMEDQFLQHRLLNATAQHPAAHEPRVYLAHEPVLPANDYGDRAVVAESIDQANLQFEAIWILFDLRILGGAASARGQIE